jgi:hypothetical protein
MECDLLIADAEATEQSFLRQWREALGDPDNPYAVQLADIALTLSTEPAAFRKHIDAVGVDSDGHNLPIEKGHRAL